VQVSCGPWRDEVARLTLEHIQQRDGRWCVIDLVGKKGHVRTFGGRELGRIRREELQDILDSKAILARHPYY
jgi:hypothetical protein